MAKKMEITERDKIMLSNLPKIMKMGKFELTGDEIIAASQVFSYIGGLIKRVDESLAEKPVAKAEPSPEKPKRKTRRKASTKIEE